MAVNPSLTQLFGTGATQTETSITIQKDQLPGLTATANNSAEGIAVAILKRWSLGQDNSADSELAVRIQPPSVAQRGGVTKTLYRYLIDLYAPYTGPTEPDPDDF
ncbi:hypothetical protein RIF25_09410 [Thermosynechococcaceae cyanobacterium BACA0444]|uniref:Uncharacterized protein n=1 Tax=Pseudocalidococcus azoricus BACA0444 TaxID=2918990 RepID=A0AAE4FUB0_9CYAN|nr:hypothetical protein [Pseudocalidococcus azoricus]MDS3861025.1 hypothetical protein [Pseudocalidococcus azoricus BACA0444]